MVGRSWVEMDASAFSDAAADFGQVIQARLDGEPRKFLMTAVPIPEFAPVTRAFTLISSFHSQRSAVARIEYQSHPSRFEDFH